MVLHFAWLLDIMLHEPNLSKRTILLPHFRHPVAQWSTVYSTSVTHHPTVLTNLLSVIRRAVSTSVSHWPGRVFQTSLRYTEHRTFYTLTVQTAQIFQSKQHICDIYNSIRTLSVDSLDFVNLEICVFSAWSLFHLMDSKSLSFYIGDNLNWPGSQF